MRLTLQKWLWTCLLFVRYVKVKRFLSQCHATQNFTKRCFTVAAGELTNYCFLSQDSLTDGNLKPVE